MGDLLILIAALGVGMWGARNLWFGLTGGPLQGWWNSTPGHLVIAAMLSAFAMPMTVACLALRLRQPRPPWRRVFIRPGAAALLACCLVFAARLLELVAVFHSPTGGPVLGQGYPIRVSDTSYVVLVESFFGNGAMSSVQVGECFSVMVASFAYPCGYAVGGVWLVQAASGRWRPEKSWIDRLGRSLGLIWISITILTAIPV